MRGLSSSPGSCPVAADAAAAAPTTAATAAASTAIVCVSLQGRPGNPGPQGAPGENGAQGTSGADGEPGRMGPSGERVSSSTKAEICFVMLCYLMLPSFYFAIGTGIAAFSLWILIAKLKPRCSTLFKKGLILNFVNASVWCVAIQSIKHLLVCL